MDMSKAGLTQIHDSQNRRHCRTASSERTRTKRGSITTIDDAEEIMITKKRIGRIVFKNVVDINDVDSRSLQRMIPHFSKLNKSEIPTPDELKGWILQDVLAETQAYVDGIKKTWVHTGCSILLDGWTNANGRYLVNVLVDCPKGTIYLYSSDVTDRMRNMDAMVEFLSEVVGVVGYENVVQIITNSTSAFMKEAGKLLMAKFPSIFWSVSASDCIQLMLEKMERMDVVKNTLEKAEIITTFIHGHLNVLKLFQEETNGMDLVYDFKIRSIQPYFILEDLVLQKDALIRIMNNSLTLGEEGRRHVADLVGDWLFWGDASTVLKGVFPLIRVMEWLNGGDKEQAGLIYETIDQAKETIKQGFRNRKSEYEPFWEVIDDVWNELLHSPLHVVGYYFNPTFFYSSDFYVDNEVVIGFYTYLTRTTRDLSAQVEIYKRAEGSFRLGLSVERRTNISPALWWATYGADCKELQRLVIRVMSQTCDGGSKFLLRRSAAETIFNTRVDQRKQQADMVYLRYNLQLQNFSSEDVD